MAAESLAAATPNLLQRARWAVTDTVVLTRRNLMVWARVPAFLVFTLVQPVMFVLMFRYVFGGAIPVHIPGGYVNYLMPGILGQTAAFACFGTAIALARELQKGTIDRFRSMPMARGAVLTGRLAGDTLRMTVTVLVVLGVGYAVGFRFSNGAGAAVGMVLLAIAFGAAMCTISAYIGLSLKDEETVQSGGLIWLFPLTFVSSAFVPVQSMPGWLQAFANNQPVTFVIDTMRSLALGGPLLPHLWQAVISIVGIFAVFGPLAVRAYKKAS
jgi:ABC-2 type transport system permease protein/oleandomycin transport system permease protein